MGQMWVERKFVVTNSYDLTSIEPLNSHRNNDLTATKPSPSHKCTSPVRRMLLEPMRRSISLSKLPSYAKLSFKCSKYFRETFNELFCKGKQIRGAEHASVLSH